MVFMAFVGSWQWQVVLPRPLHSGSRQALTAIFLSRYIHIYILVLTCSLNEQKYGGTFHFEFGHEVHLTGMYVNCALSVI